MFHFTPTSASWLNAVEGFFAKLAKRRLKRGVFRSVVDLQATINRFIAEHNQTPKPFLWRADPDAIIAARNRGFQPAPVSRCMEETLSLPRRPAYWPRGRLASWYRGNTEVGLCRNAFTLSGKMMRDAGMKSIQQEHSRILRHIPSGSTVAYLDYPIHTNVGDLLIMAGTLRFFIRNGINLGCIANAYNFSEKKKLEVEKCDVVILHGGGNFGDLYDDHQSFREHVLNLFPNKPIVIFPQTIHFGNSKNIAKAASIFQDRENIMLFVRDLNSLHIVTIKFCRSC